MFTSRSKLSIVAISVLGLAGWTAPGPGGQDAPNSAPADSPRVTPETRRGPAKRPEIVLLSDGRIVTGVVSEDEGMIVVIQPIGTMKFPKKRVERVFASIRDVYAYKLEQFPENDFDERINLAKWCLAQKLEPEAREQLEAVLQRSPKHAQAKAMLVSLDQAQARLAMRSRDPAVRQTSGETPRRVPADRPGVLDASVFSGALRGMGIPDFPVIYDLPQALAVKRFDEFGRYVHPVLQTYCARCHDDRYDGSFQLISFRNKADRTPAALRANLDATLKLIDRDNPAHSELLSSALRPHGRGPNPRPIFKGSNDGAYQILATWINRLQGRKTADTIVPASMTSTGTDSGEVFASQRGAITNGSEAATPAVKPFVTGPVEHKSLPPMRAIAGQHTLVPDTNPDPDEFPLPFAVGGVKPKGVTNPHTPRSAGQTPTLPPLSAAKKADDGVTAAVETKATNPSAGLTDAAATNARAAVDAETDGAPAKTADAASRKPRKPIKFDPSLLQRALQLKNQNRTQQ